MTDARTITLADPRGRWHGTYGVRRCPAHGDSSPSLSIRNGASAPIFTCHAGCPSSDVAAALAGEGFALTNGSPDPEAIAKRQADARADQERRVNRARTIWSEGAPIGGTLAEAYLVSRAIRPPWPPTLRFHGSLWNSEAGCELSAMIGAVVRDGEGLTGTHRTWITEPGRRADLDRAKTMLGSCRGGAVHFSEVAGTLVVCEGIETALSLRDALAGEPVAVWGALSAPGIASLELPAWASDIVAAPDNDAAGRAAAERLGERCAERGIPFRVMAPPSGCSDWNDLAQAEAVR